FYATHSDKGNTTKKRVCQSLQCRMCIRGNGASCRHADVRRPNTEFASRKRTYAHTPRPAILQTKIEATIRACDPFLNDKFRYEAKGLTTNLPSFLDRSNLIPSFELMTAIFTCSSCRLDNAWVGKFTQPNQVIDLPDYYRTRHRETMGFSHFLKTCFVH